MKRTIFTFGAIAGLVVITGMIVVMRLAGDEGMQLSEWLGYLIMILALSVIFVGIKRHRDRELGGVIRFGQAVLVGLGISAVAGVIYVGVWELYLASTDHAFIEQYTTQLIEAKKAAGVSGAELATAIAEVESMKEQYANPFFRIPITFLEIFPVGLLVSLVSAALLRNSRFLPAG